MESPTIRKVRGCFGEAEEQLFSPSPSVIEVIAVEASYYFVNGLTSNIFTVYTSQIIARLSPNSFLCFTGNLVNVVYS